MIKILTVIGARPQFIKAANFSRFLKHKTDFVQETIVHTGQHYDNKMSNVFFEELEIPPPKYNLSIGGLSHGEMTGKMIEAIEKVVYKEGPDWMLVYGDTNSTLAATIVSSKMSIKLAHVEAGLRSFNMKMPEEVNRILTDRGSNLLFCPTKLAVENLVREGSHISNFQKIINSGDIMYEGALYYKNRSYPPPEINNKRDFIVATIHRQETTASPKKLTSVLEALDEINQTTEVIMPIHPRTLKVINQTGIKTSIRLIDPVSYLNMVWLIQNSTAIITDSGGLQKEAYFFNKKCITLREETEWVELINSKNNLLVGLKKEKIINAYKELTPFKTSKAKIYGDGNTSSIIYREIINY